MISKCTSYTQLLDPLLHLFMHLFCWVEDGNNCKNARVESIEDMRYCIVRSRYMNRPSCAGLNMVLGQSFYSVIWTWQWASTEARSVLAQIVHSCHLFQAVAATAGENPTQFTFALECLKCFILRGLSFRPVAKKALELLISAGNPAEWLVA